MVVSDGFVQAWDGPESFAAFTVAELGEMLPHCDAHEESDAWAVSFYDDKNRNNIFRARAEADARAKMLVYLLKNKLLAL